MTPWGEMMRAAVAVGVSPEGFWRLSVREWRWLTAGDGAVPMARGSLETMMRRWPDGVGRLPPLSGEGGRSAAKTGWEGPR